MKLSIFSRVTKFASACAILLGTSSAFVALSAEPAFAQSASTSSGRGSSGRGGTRVLTADLDNTGAGAPDVKASHGASAVASANSQDELNSYRDERVALTAAEAEQNEALKEYMRLKGLSEDEISAEFPDGSYEAALAAATLDFAHSKETVSFAQAAVDQSLLRMTGGRALSEDELASLHSILGL